MWVELRESARPCLSRATDAFARQPLMPFTEERRKVPDRCGVSMCLGDAGCRCDLPARHGIVFVDRRIGSPLLLLGGMCTEQNSCLSTQK